MMGTMEKNEKDSTNNNKHMKKYRGIKAMPFVMGNETFEKLGTIGTSANLLVYLTTVFNMKNITATNLINIFNGTCNFGTLLGAFLSDTYFGRYKTLGFASISSFLGMLLLALTAAVENLHPPKCGKEESSIRKGPTSDQMAFLLAGLVLLVIGASGIRLCNLAFGADQFNPNSESGRKGRNSFFNWYYFTYTLAVLISMTLIVYVQSNISWSLGLAIPTALMFLSCILFFLGTKIYVKIMPQGSPLTSVAQVVVATFKKRALMLQNQPSANLFNYIPSDSINANLPFTDQFRFLNKATIMTSEDRLNPNGSAANPWRLCSIQQVEEVKCLLRVIPIWVACIFYYITIIQQQTYVVFQALKSNRRLGNTNFEIPAATYIGFSMLSLSIWIPIYDRVVIPSLRKLTKKEDVITLLQKIGVGLFLSVITMFISAFVENQRRITTNNKAITTNVPRKGEVSSMYGLWLIPQLALAGVSEAFTVIGQVEFYYNQFPENMRSFGGSLLFCGIAMSSYLSSLLISVVHKVTEGGINWLAEDLNKGRLDYFYYMIAGLEVFNFGYFIVCARWYKYKGTSSNGNITKLPSV